MKETMSSFDVAAVLLEIASKVEKARINNIYQVSPKTIILKLHKPDQPSFFLLIEAGKRIHLTWLVMEKPQKPPDFCMVLRKYLGNATITEIKQQEFERIVTIKAVTNNGKFCLISELFDEGNIILTNQKNEIMHALTYKKMRDREIIRNAVFKYPPQSGKNPLTLSKQEVVELKRFGKLEIVKAITRLLAVGGLYSEEILLRAKIDKNMPCESLSELNIKAIYESIQDILFPLKKGELTPCMVRDEEGQLIDVIPFLLKKYEKLHLTTYSSINEALDEYYATAFQEKQQEKQFEKTEKEIEKHERIIESQKKAWKDTKLEREKNKIIGDTIYMHFNELQQLLQEIKKAEEERTIDKTILEIEREKKREISPAKYFHSLNQKQRLLEVNIADITFQLKLNRTIQANAEEYYTRAKKAQKKLEGTENSIKETTTKIDELKNKMLTEERQTQQVTLRKIRKKLWYEKFRWFYSSDGFLVIGGKDAITNEIIIKKHTELHDIVFHADIVGAPFVVIKTSGKCVPEQTLKEAAEFAASYSRAWREKMRAVNVYWIRPEQVSKTPPSGEYLKKGAFMIYGKKNYVRNVQLAIAIGVAFKENKPHVIGGAKNAIAKQTNFYVDIIPGDSLSGKLAKQIIHVIKKKVPVNLQRMISEVSLIEIQQFIPFGSGQIVS